MSTNDEFPDCLSNMKWQVLEIYAYRQHRTDSASYNSIFICLYVWVTAMFRRRGHEFKREKEGA